MNGPIDAALLGHGCVTWVSWPIA